MSRVLLVTNIPTPYRIPLFNELAVRFQAAGYPFRVAFAAMGYARRQWDVDPAAFAFEHEVLQGRTMPGGRDGERTIFSYGGLRRTLRAYRPSVVIVPGFSAATMRLWCASLLGGPRYVIWSGSVAANARLNAPWRRLLRRRLASGAAAAIAYGSAARDYMGGLGLPAERVHIGINTVDTAFFVRETGRLREAAPAKRLTYIGYLSLRKNVGRVLELAAHLAAHRDDFVVDVVGDGTERPALEAETAARGLRGRVRFHGYHQQEALPAFLACSSGLLFQTDFDIWGLTLVEAMAAGVPCLASVRAGATRDLIEDGVTGFAVDFADVASAAERAAWLLDHPAEGAAMGRRAQRYVTEHATLAKSADGFVAAVRQALEGRQAMQAAGGTR